MRIYDNEHLLKARLIEETSYPYFLSQKAERKELSDREKLCIALHIFCKWQYDKITPTNLKYNRCIKDNFIPSKNGWYLIYGMQDKGRFICASRLFEEVFCQEGKCHLSAYYFALDSKLKADLIFGSINPFNINNGLFHSICLFKLNGQEFVFDGANYLVMNKELYYHLFNFKAIQHINKEDLIKDKAQLSKPAFLKDTKGYKLSKQGLGKRFYGLGFMAYLYDRQDFFKNSDKQCKNFTKVVSDYSKFSDELEREENKYQTAISLSEVIVEDIARDY